MKLIAVSLVIIVVSGVITGRAEADCSVTVTGQLTWNDRGTWKGVERATVYLMDSDDGFDDVLVQGVTDAQGNYRLTGTGGDGWFGDPDVYVKFELSNNWVNVETSTWFNWTANTNVRDNFCGAWNVGALTFSPPGSDGERALNLFAKMMEQYGSFFRATGQEIPQNGGVVDITYPAWVSTGVPWTDTTNIRWPGGYNRLAAVYHEFGHRIRHAQDGDLAHFYWDALRFGYPRSHSFSLISNEGFAFNEGWCEYNEALYDTTQNGEPSTWRQLPGGNETEGNVALQIWNLSQRCGGFANMWAVLQSVPSESIHSWYDFVRAARARFPACFKTGGGPRLTFDTTNTN
ncbi:MAG: hypothetical protein HYY84_02215 [Deltaproteobacteria bacterium]|nr:hypothetical protein [Deltaproteobacteria bacterium]